jgi:hypothetical protein
MLQDYVITIGLHNFFSFHLQLFSKNASYTYRVMAVNGASGNKFEACQYVRYFDFIFLLKSNNSFSNCIGFVGKRVVTNKKCYNCAFREYFVMKLSHYIAVLYYYYAINQSINNQIYSELYII